MLTKFSKDQRSLDISFVKCLNFKFLWYKIIYKNKFMNKIVNKILINTKFDIGVKNVKNMKFNN